MASIESLLEEARKRLVETGTRNRLIHVNRQAKRANVLNIINERSEDVFELIRTQSKKMRFAGKGSEDADDSEITLSTDNFVEESRYTDLILETPLTPDALQKRLLRLSSDAKTAEEEQGINILYLNLGFLRWYEDNNSNVLRESPLILLPVELVRNDRTSTYDIKCRDDDIMTNLPLQERLKMDFGINLPEIDDSEDWTPSEYFRKVEDAISPHSRWSLDHDGIQLGFFSFAKLLMLRDLDPSNWASGKLLDNRIVSSLLAEGFESEPSLFPEDSNLDETLSPEKIIQVVDADSSQTKVIEEVRSGRNLVVQGPPGTGKSQTITNIISGAVYDGKTVLFVAEKMAALDVVHRRMVKVGLKDVCLELHSRTANKKAFLEEIATTLSNGKNVESLENNASELTRCRDKLNKLSSTMHSIKGTVPRTPYEVLSLLIKFTGVSAPPPSISTKHLIDLTHDQENQIIEQIALFCEVIKNYGVETDHPFRGSTNLNLQPTDLLRLDDRLAKIVGTLKILEETHHRLSNILGTGNEQDSTIDALNTKISVIDRILEAPQGTADVLSICYNNCEDKNFLEALTISNDWVVEKKNLSDIFVESAWNQSITHLRHPLVKGCHSWISRIFGKYRSASNELSTLLKEDLPKNPDDRLKLVDSLINAQSKLRMYEEEKGYLERSLTNHWKYERTSFADLIATTEWLLDGGKSLLQYSSTLITQLLSSPDLTDLSSRNVGSSIDQLKQEINAVSEILKNSHLSFDSMKESSFAGIADRILSMRSKPESYEHWVAYTTSRQHLIDRDLNDLIAFAEKHIDKTKVLTEFLYALSEERWNLLVKQRPELTEISRENRNSLVEEFQKLDAERIISTSTIIRSQHLSNLPQGAVGEMGLIRGEIAKKRRHKPIRQVISQAGSMVQRIKPVFLMSPISVAQFIPPEKLEFDLLVIDEASQVRPEDALGSIARTKQIVVVGDQKQLPPTSFFDRLTDNVDDVDEDDTEGEIQITSAVEMESVLSLCEARGLSQRMLEWHYRSRDPSLITISNIEFYGNGLILPPSPTESDESFGLKLTRVPGVYSSKSRGGGRPGTNRIEAEEIVKRISEISRSRSQFSVGIVTFSKSQADMVTEVLEVTRRNDSVLDDFLKEGKSEGVFVKNIENVQGDERDIILISVGYGPHEPNAKLPSMNFGPINSEGGERRLNVLFSRSRIACEVFTSFDPRDIDTSRTTKVGPRILKRFLEYADTGHIPEELTFGGDADSPFEEDVAESIRAMGYTVDHQVGTAGFKIDLGVRSLSNNSHYILAVECDGATYHSALWARERDRLRQQILEGFGWTFHRIWSTDWFYRRTHEIDRLKHALIDASSKDILQSFSGANESDPTRELDPVPTIDLSAIDLDIDEITVPAYKKWAGSADSYYEPHERPIHAVTDMVQEIVLQEGPIHTDEVARRYASAHGKTRVGNRIQEIVLRGLSRSKKNGDIEESDGFWGTNEQFSNPPIRNRESETSLTIKPQYISQQEIRACEKLISEQSGEVPLEEMVRSIARVFGFKRAGPEFQSRISKVLTSK